MDLTNEPVAWMRPSEEGYDSAFRDDSTIKSCTGWNWDGWIPLYTHPAELTEDMLWEFAEKFLDTDAPWGEANVTGIGHFIEAILRKAQEK